MTTIARLSAPIIADAASGRWVLSTGAPCLTAIEGVNNGEPITLVVDLATLRIPAKAMILSDHEESIGSILGTWTDLRLSDVGGPALTSIPAWIQLPPAPVDGCDPDGFRRSVLLIIAQGVPLQASVGVAASGAADSGFRKLLQAETVNGRDIQPAAPGQPPVFIGSNLDLREGSVVLFGADSHTGALLRQLITATQAHQPPKEKTMPEITIPERMKALLKQYPLHKAMLAEAIAEGKDDAAIAADIAAAEVADLNAKLSAMTGERDKLQAACAKLQESVATLTKSVSDLGGKLPEGAAGSEETSAAPANLAEAMTRHKAELSGKPMADRLAFLRRTYPTIKN